MYGTAKSCIKKDNLLTEYLSDTYYPSSTLEHIVILKVFALILHSHTVM